MSIYNVCFLFTDHNYITCDIKIVDTDKNIYEVICYNDKSATNAKLGCCSITQKFPFDGLAYEWGANCIKQENELNDHLQIIAFKEPTKTTCQVKFTLLTKYTTNGIETLSEFFFYFWHHNIKEIYTWT